MFADNKNGSTLICTHFAVLTFLVTHIYHTAEIDDVLRVCMSAWRTAAHAKPGDTYTRDFLCTAFATQAIVRIQ